MSAQCHPAASAGDKGGTPGWHRGPALPPTPTMHRLLLGHGLAAGRIAGLSAGRCPACSRGGWDVPGEGHSRTGEGCAASRSPGLSWAAVLAGFSEAPAHFKKRLLITVSAQVLQQTALSCPQRWARSRSGLWAIFRHRFVIQREGQKSQEYNMHSAAGF